MTDARMTINFNYKVLNLNWFRKANDSIYRGNSKLLAAHTEIQTDTSLLVQAYFKIDYCTVFCWISVNYLNCSV